MNDKKLNIFAWFMIAVFLGVLLYFIVGIAKQIDNNRDFTKNKFFSTVENITQIENKTGFLTHEYHNAIQNIVANDATICAIVINSRGENIAYPVNSTLIVVDSYGNKSLSTSSSMIKIYSNTSDTNETTITVAMYIIKPSNIYKRARISFLIVLASTLLIFIVILFVSTTTKSELSDSTDSTDSDNIVDLVFNNNTIKKKPVINKSDIIEQPTEETSSIDEYEDENSNAKFLDNVLEMNETLSDSSSVFSLTTGYCHEKDLESRLDFELSKATSSEYDLSLVLFQIQDFKHNNEITKKITSTINSLYDKKNLIFNYKDNGYAFLLLYTDLNDSMHFAERLYTAIHEQLSENKSAEVGLGIATRSIRIIPSRRLILEAEQALSRAYDETELPIVAFKIDPEKYRQCLKQSL